MLTIFRDTASADPDKTWIGNGLFKRHVADPKELEALQLMAREGKMTIFANGIVQILPENIFGVDLAQVTAQAVVNQPFPYYEPRTGNRNGDTTIANALGAADLQFVATRDEVEK